MNNKNKIDKFVNALKTTVQTVSDKISDRQLAIELTQQNETLQKENKNLQDLIEKTQKDCNMLIEDSNNRIAETKNHAIKIKQDCEMAIQEANRRVADIEKERDRIIEDAHNRILYVEQDCNRTIENAEKHIKEVENDIIKIQKDSESTIKEANKQIAAVEEDAKKRIAAAEEIRNEAIKSLKQYLEMNPNHKDTNNTNSSSFL